jgi:hypothetical protein
MQHRFWRKQHLGFLAGLAVLSLSAASLQAQDTTSAGQARMDTTSLDTSATDSTKLDSAKVDSAAWDSTKQDSTKMKLNPPGYQEMKGDTSGAAGDTSAAVAPDQSTGGYTDSTLPDSASLKPTAPAAGDTAASDTSKMGP